MPNLSISSGQLSQMSREEKLALLEAASERMARRALEDKWFWLTQCTRTKDEQENDPLNRFKPFPDWEFIPHILEALDHEKVVFIEKSRTMMQSWTVSAWAAHTAFCNPASQVIFQSEDESRAINCLNYVKTLWEQSLPELRARWRVAGEKQDIWEQGQRNLFMENGSEFLALVGNPDKIRSLHPTIYIADEAAHMSRGEDSFNNAVATRCPHVICLTSAFPGWFREMTEFAVPVDWPEYGRAA